ncbi:YdeI/OmpD-associated family protein [Flavobacterium muglaense]|uniref:YdeI/OmpD-associated family protein n=1 Tax=Flavobacterium muglaense TaxID=2764716 RepID=A0A923N0L1_9FLAO|nr:YdeI/OmpD-associated family protein [Flavobacterium muglaense]MBC5838675.1 YdeI/OmpD-associated family protein [Flavobacterium muglaense]MBC5845191.1 YdeI/OmpD-associated family protein [Flavobacterium muglaense]
MILLHNHQETQVLELLARQSLNNLLAQTTLEEKELLYLKNALEWRNWLHENHANSKGIYLLLYKINSSYESMRWEEAVKVALCYGWIDSTAKKIDNEARQQTFTPRKDKSVWSKVNKSHIEQLLLDNLMHQSGLTKIETAKQNGSWTALDQVEDLIIPADLQDAFDTNSNAYKNYLNFSPSYRKSYLYWLHQAKRTETRNKRINEIVHCCENNLKSRI